MWRGNPFWEVISKNYGKHKSVEQSKDLVILLVAWNGRTDWITIFAITALSCIISHFVEKQWEKMMIMINVYHHVYISFSLSSSRSVILISTYFLMYAIHYHPFWWRWWVEVRRSFLFYFIHYILINILCTLCLVILFLFPFNYFLPKRLL